MGFDMGLEGHTRPQKLDLINNYDYCSETHAITSSKAKGDCSSVEVCARSEGVWMPMNTQSRCHTQNQMLTNNIVTPTYMVLPLKPKLNIINTLKTHTAQKDQSTLAS